MSEYIDCSSVSVDIDKIALVLYAMGVMQRTIYKYNFILISIFAAFVISIPSIGLVCVAGAVSTISPDSSSVAGGTTAQITLGDVQYVQVSAGYNHSLALTPDGTVYSWGYNEDGQLGHNTALGSTTPVLIPTVVHTAGTPMEGKTIISVVTGDGYSIAIDSDGVVYSWGVNSAGQLGNGTTAPSYLKEYIQ